MWKKLIDLYGTQRELARALGVTPSTLNYRVKRGRPVLPEWAIEIERQKPECITRHEIRPDLWPAA